MRARDLRDDLLARLAMAAVAAHAAVAAGCGPGLTEVIVLVDSDLAMPAEADRVTVDVALASGFTEQRVWQAADGGALPLSMQIEGGETAPDAVDVTATAWRGDQPVVAQTQRFGVTEGESRRLDLTLCSSCRLVVPCAASETCVDGACVGVTAATTDEWNGDPETVRQCSALDMCPPGMAHRDDGRCQPAGIPRDACAEGFVADGTGACAAVLPAAPCDAGSFAVPGETECHEVAPCAPGTWGDIPIAADTVHVDAAYVGADEDGSAQRPYRTIQAAVDAAAPGAIVAVAAGQYEPVTIASKSVQLWGVCPALVEVAASDFDVAAITVEDAPGTVVRGVSAKASNAPAIRISSVQTAVEHVWVHDTDWYGILVQAGGDAIISDSLVEGAKNAGIFSTGKTALVRSTIRDTRSYTNPDGQEDGHGLAVPPYGSLEASACMIERNETFGALVNGGHLALHGSVVRDTDVGGIDTELGWGVHSYGSPEVRGSLDISGSAIENNAGVGVRVERSDATLVNTVVRDTRVGLHVGPEESELAGWGVVARGSDQDEADAARLTMTWSVVERSASANLKVNDSDATLLGSVLRDVSAVPGAVSGFGAEVTRNQASEAPSTLSMQGSVVERVHNAGLRMLDSDLSFQRSVVRSVASGGESGDCIAVVSDVGSSKAMVEGSHIAACERVGLFNAGSHVTIAQNQLRCSPLHIDGEEFVERPPVFLDRGGNSCGCDGEIAACVIQQAGLPVPFQKDARGR